MAGVHSLASNFNKQVSAYEQARPGYPQTLITDIVTKLGLKKGDRVMDMAAGNGKLTRMLVPFSFDLVAVEPAAGMRDGFKNILPDVPIVEGTSTSIPFPDNSFAAIFIAQAFHWFANKESLLEFRRILKKGGHLILVWNAEKRDRPWSDFVHDLLEQPINFRRRSDKLVALHAERESNAPQYRHGKWRNVWQEHADTLPFEPLQHMHEDNPVPMTRDLIWLRILSISYVSSLSPAQQEELKGKVAALLEENVPEFIANKDPSATVDYPYGTDVYYTTAK